MLKSKRSPILSRWSFIFIYRAHILWIYFFLSAETVTLRQFAESVQEQPLLNIKPGVG